MVVTWTAVREADSARSLLGGLLPAGPVSSEPPASPLPKDPRFDALLARLAREARGPALAASAAAGGLVLVDALSAPLRAAAGAGVLRFDAEGRVLVMARVAAGGDEMPAPAAAVAPAIAALAGLGARTSPLDRSGSLIEAWIPVAMLEAAASLPEIRFMRAPLIPAVDAGSRLTEGDAIVRGERARAAFGVDGTGVRVGVISDGIFGLTEAVDRGDLPPTDLAREGGRLVATTGGVSAVSFRADGDLEAGLGTPGSRGAEGVAMLEIVHDLAPGARLYFANFGTASEFNQAVSFLAARTDVLVDDISFFGGPYDGTSAVSANASAALAGPATPLRAFFTSAGNRARDHYEGTYVASSEDGAPLVGRPGRFHLFRPTAGTSDAFGVGPRASNPLFLSAGMTAVVILTWDDPQGGSRNDYDLYLFRNGTGQLVESSTGEQSGSQDPFEVIVYSNPGPSGFFDVRIQNVRDHAEPRSLEMFLLESPFRAVLPGGTTFNFNALDGSIPMMADAGGGVLTVGAVDAADPGNDDIEPFSGRGPTNDGRLKPDLTGVDGVSVTGAGGFPTTFFGTSAAAPHAAGAAALLLQMAPCLLAPEGDTPAAGERTRLASTLLGRCADLGGAGPDTTFGMGRLDVFDACADLVPVAEAGADVRSAECGSFDGARVPLDAAASRASPPDCPLRSRWTGPFGALEGARVEATLGLGRHDVTLEVSQNGTTWTADHQVVIVQDTSPPSVAVSASPSLLWPPDHRMVPVALAPLAEDLCDPAPSVVLDSAASSEPDDAPGLGDGATTADVQAQGPGGPDLAIALRAERDARGAGRTYTLVVTATDASGNESAAGATVLIPRDLGAGAAGGRRGAPPAGAAGGSGGDPPASVPAPPAGGAPGGLRRRRTTARPPAAPG